MGLRSANVATCGGGVARPGDLDAARNRAGAMAYRPRRGRGGPAGHAERGGDRRRGRRAGPLAGRRRGLARHPGVRGAGADAERGVRGARRCGLRPGGSGGGGRAGRAGADARQAAAAADHPAGGGGPGRGRRKTGLLGVAARLPVPAWLPALDLDTTAPAEVRRAAPSPGDVAVTAGWRRMRGPADLAALDPAVEGWEATRALLSGRPV
ncbi:hypothetical protein MCBG_04814 [Micromonospora sp. M42]|nr:hypothetical protein MCBG_04814 [Micromonospora sp. M42]